MGVQAEKVSYEKSDWFEEARELIQRSERGTPDHLDWIENQIRSGGILLYRVKGNEPGQLLGIFTARPETLYNGERELMVIHAVEVEPTETPYICTLFPVIHDLAAKSGFVSWRVHADRPGMAKRLLQHGFEYQETVFVRKVA